MSFDNHLTQFFCDLFFIIKYYKTLFLTQFSASASALLYLFSFGATSIFDSFSLSSYYS
jgi:hypothetical protein